MVPKSALWASPCIPPPYPFPLHHSTCYKISWLVSQNFSSSPPPIVVALLFPAHPFPSTTPPVYNQLLSQSRQSAKRFSSRRNWDSPTPLAAGKCAPPPFGTGGGHTGLRLKGWGSPNSNEGTFTVVLYIYKYFEAAIITANLLLFAASHTGLVALLFPAHPF